MSKVVGDDPDSCIPAPLKDFVFDLHDSARRSQVASEQSAQYNGQFTDLSNKYFAQSAWPSPESIASECSNDPLFLAFYKELTHRHLHSVTRISVQDRVNGWHVYRELFDLLLQEAESESETKQTQPSLYILPEWAFDILHEFVYQFQGFCQFRTQNAANKIAQQEKENNNKGETPSKSSSNLDNTMEILRSNQDAWAVESVLYYLNRLVALSSSNNLAYRHLSIFSSVALSRLECLMGDYRGSLNAASHLLLPNDDEEESTMSIVNEVFPAKLSLSYHAGISYLMLRRYKDAFRILEDICVLLQRGFKTGMLRKLHASHDQQSGKQQGSFDQFVKLFDRMICLLAILTHICPISQKKMDDGIKKQIRDKHANQLSKIEQGEEGYEELFMYACPKFISPACPDYEGILEQKDTGIAVQAQGPQDAYRLQIKQFMLEMTQQQSLRKLRSYMKLYTSIEIGKLAAFNDTVEDDFLARLVSFKHKMNQLEANSTSSTDDEENNNTDAAEAECMGSALDIHYHINKNMVHVDEAEKLRRFETYFLKGIKINQEVLKDVSTIETAV